MQTSTTVSGYFLNSLHLHPKLCEYFHRMCQIFSPGFPFRITSSKTSQFFMCFLNFHLNDYISPKNIHFIGFSATKTNCHLPGPPTDNERASIKVVVSFKSCSLLIHYANIAYILIHQLILQQWLSRTLHLRLRMTTHVIGNNRCDISIIISSLLLVHAMLKSYRTHAQARLYS